MAFEFLTASLQERQEQGLLRKPVLAEQYQAQYIRVAGRSYINFSSNDYLGMAQHPALLSGLSKPAFPGSGGSPLVTGHSAHHQALIDYICEHTGRTAGMLCNSGFAANFALLQSLCRNKNDIAILDKLAHASMIDGALASGGKLSRFRHNDTYHLQQRLEASEGHNRLVVTEGIFSMDGDSAPVAEVSELCHQHDAWLMVDDAHAVGIRGDYGLAHAESLSMAALPVWMATFGKAIGTGGAIICGNETLIDYLNNFARHYIYSTAMSPLQAQLTLRSLQLIREENWRREKLMELIALFKQQAQQAGIKLLASDSAIQPVIIGDPVKALEVSQQLKDSGFWVTAIRTPTVPAGADRLRITLTALHKQEDITSLISRLRQALQL